MKTDRLTLFPSEVDRLKREHQCLKSRVTSIYEQVLISRSEGEKSMAALFRTLQEQMERLMEELEEYGRWEEYELFPAIARHFNMKIAPSIMPSLWVLEKDHLLALKFIRPFLEQCREILAQAGDETPVQAEIIEKAKHTAVLVLQVCLMLQEHFTMEEKLIFPLVDEMLHEIKSIPTL
jgi:regulator of cell morphogenesis and NO signaling